MANPENGVVPPTPPEKPTESTPDPPSTGRQLTEIIPPGLDSVLRTAGVDTADPNVTKTIEIMLFRGQLPLPPPPILAEYEKHFPGLCDKLVGWTEAQRTHRQALERQRTDGQETRMNRGQFIAGGVALWGLTMAVIAGVWSPAVGVVIAIVSIGGPTAAIWLARNTGTPKTPPIPAPKTTPPTEPSHSN
jgi:uncharacterized membrane protein